MFIFLETIYSLRQRELFATDVDVLQKFPASCDLLNFNTNIYKKKRYIMYERCDRTFLLFFYFLTIVILTSLISSTSSFAASLTLDRRKTTILITI